MYQQGERKPMHGWLQGRFTVRLLDFLVEKLVGVRRADSGEGVEVVIDFKRPRKADSDADKAIRMWLDSSMNIEIAAELGSVPSYITRLLKLGAKRLGSTLEALRAQRKPRTPDASKMPLYRCLADEAKTLWWDELLPVATIAKRELHCSTVTVEAAKRWWYESRGLKPPSNEEWCREVERRVLELFDADELTVGEIADKVHRAHGTVMQIVKEACRRLRRSLPDARIRRSRLKGSGGNASEPAA